MSTDPREPIAYASPTTPPNAWTLLRLAVIVWASLVIVRHLTYWAGVIAMNIGNSTTPFGGGFPFAPIEAAAESAILLAALVIAVAHRSETANAVRALRILGIAFITLVLVDLALNGNIIAAAQDSVGDHVGRQVLRIVWQVVSKLQLLVVPLLCVVYPRRG